MSIDAITWFVERAAEYGLEAVSSWSNVRAALAQIPLAILDLSHPLAWPYLLSSLVIAWILFLAVKRRGETECRSFVEFAFPARLYRHPSTRLDWKFGICDLTLQFLLYTPVMTGMGLLGAKAMTALLVGSWGWEPPHTLSVTGIAAAAVGWFVLHDFVNYCTHVLFHRIPLLWSFHRVHHSAEVLTPATAFRVHPVELLAFAAIQAPVLGTAAVLYQNILGEEQRITMVFGVSVFTFVSGILGSHLRHSHVWFSYGPVLNRVFMSPAHHQIHHSVDAHHWNKNFAVKLAVWDALFGTLYLPGRREALSVGLPDADRREFTSVSGLYLSPFVRAFQALVPMESRRG